MEQEQERGITITSAATTCSGWDGRPPTPAPLQHHRHPRPRRLHHRGRAFAAPFSTARSAVFDANAGVEPQTETVWRQADKYGCRGSVFVNKMDKIGADFFNCVDMIKDRTGARPLPIQMPIGAEIRVRRHRRSHRDEGMGLEGRGSRRRAGSSTSAPIWPTRPPNGARRWSKLAVEQDDDAMEAYLEATSRTKRRCAAAYSQGHLSCRLRAGPVWLGLQEQGRAAAAERRDRLSARPLDVPAYMGFRAWRRDGRPAISSAPTMTSRCPVWPSRS